MDYDTCKFIVTINLIRKNVYLVNKTFFFTNSLCDSKEIKYLHETLKFISKGLNVETFHHLDLMFGSSNKKRLRTREKLLQ